MLLSKKSISCSVLKILKVAIVIIVLKKRRAFAGKYTFTRGKCTINYKAFIMPQRNDSDPASKRFNTKLPMTITEVDDLT